MLENQKIRPAQVIGPLGEPLTLDSLPAPSTTRWVVRRKAAVVAAVAGGPPLPPVPRGVRQLAARGRPQRHARPARHPHPALPRSLRAPAALLRLTTGLKSQESRSEAPLRRSSGQAFRATLASAKSHKESQSYMRGASWLRNSR